MKKLITLICTFALITINTNAQDYTPKDGDWSIGTDAASLLNYAGNLFNSNATAPSVDFSSNNMISGKLFTDDMTAWRAMLNIGVHSSDDDGDEMTSFDLSLGLGKEFRKGTNRLQGFYGYAAHLSVGSSTTTMADSDDVETSTMGFGANGFVGVEYFFAPKMGLSAEYSHGLMYSSEDDGSDDHSEFDISGGTTSINLNFYF